MNNPETPIGVNGKNLEDRKELKVTQDDKDSFSKWFEDYINETKDTNKKYTIDCMLFDIPKVAEKDINNEEKESIYTGDLLGIISNSTEMIKIPDNYTKVAGAFEKTEKNAKAYDKARAEAKKQSEARKETANKEEKPENER